MSYRTYFSFPSRTYCDILEEMRKLSSSRNYGALDGLIEELQVIGNRMEAGLDTQKTYKQYVKEIGELKKELKELREKKEEVEK